MNFFSSLPLGALLGAAVFSVSCGGESASSGDSITCAAHEMPCGQTCIPVVEPTASSLHQNVILKGCAGSNSCHTGSNPKEGLRLVSEDDFMAMIGSASKQRPELNLIEPNKPGESYLINKIRGVGMSEKSSTGNRSKQMPVFAPALCEEVILVLEEWIRSGAQ